jgi:hypothetical protein
MSGFPNFSNIASHVNTEFTRRRDNPISISTLNCWVRIASGVDNGLVLVSNPNFRLFSAAGENVSSIYGSAASSGTIGTTWDGNAVNVVNDRQVGLPKPNVTSFEVDEGSGNISRKASLTITAYTLGQLEQITKYFLEPGFTVFLEWGWNTANGVGALRPLSVKNVTRVLKASNIVEDRLKTGGQYESYLGFITGGSISFNGNAWEVSVNLTGYPELPAYLQVTDNPKKTSDTTSDTTIKSDLKFRTIVAERDLGKKRFKQMFNELPSIRRTPEVQTLLNDPLIANAVNFINFDEKVVEKINDLVKDNWLGFGADKAGGENVPSNVNPITEEKFIRFGTLMQIINTFGSATGFKVGGETIQIRINTENTPIGAFENIFSTEKSKLIIPNTKTPEFNIEKAAEFGSVSTTGVVTDCSIVYNGTTIKFPQTDPIEGGIFNGKAFFYNNDDTIVKFNKNANEWGYLDDLYVNFDFATGIMDTSKFDLKDALYQILNGMSSAANGLWNFQIQELPKADTKGLLELRVIDLNMVGISPDGTADITELNLYGANSIFMDASFDMDIGGAMMNQIIGKRLSSDTNQSSPTTQGKLFAIGSIDKVLNQIEFERKEVEIKDEPPSAEELEELKEKNLEQFFEKVGIYPKVGLASGAALSENYGDGFDKQVYFISYEDKELFNAYKSGADSLSGDNVSILLPIRFTFTVHGISGIKRGDKFVVNGLPNKYGKENGFFQVLSIKHVVDGMLWKTTVEGGFRQIR